MASTRCHLSTLTHHLLTMAANMICGWAQFIGVSLKQIFGADLWTCTDTINDLYQLTNLETKAMIVPARCHLLVQLSAWWTPPRHYSPLPMNNKNTTAVSASGFNVSTSKWRGKLHQNMKVRYCWISPDKPRPIKRDRMHSFADESLIKYLTRITPTYSSAQEKKVINENHSVLEYCLHTNYEKVNTELRKWNELNKRASWLQSSSQTGA